MCSLNALGRGAIPWSLVSLRGITLLRKTDSLSSQQLSVSGSSLARVGVLAQLSTHGGFVWPWAYAGLLHAVTSSVGSYVGLLCAL